MGLFSSREKSDLLDASTVARKPTREDLPPRRYGFPRYVNEGIDIGDLADPAPARVEYLPAVAAGPRTSHSCSMPRERILLDQRTACMIKNIPNRCAADTLMRFINETHFGMYDFFYLRMDFRSRCNVGYAFINLVDNKAVLRLYDRINGHCWNSFRSSKVAEMTYASIQGTDNLRRRFRRSLVMQEDRAFRPRIFHTEGPQKGLEKDIFE